MRRPANRNLPAFHKADPRLPGLHPHVAPAPQNRFRLPANHIHAHRPRHGNVFAFDHADRVARRLVWRPRRLQQTCRTDHRAHPAQQPRAPHRISPSIRRIALSMGLQQAGQETLAYTIRHAAFLPRRGAPHKPWPTPRQLAPHCPIPRRISAGRNRKSCRIHQRSLRYALPGSSLVPPHPNPVHRRRGLQCDSHSRPHVALRSSRLAKRRARPRRAASAASGLFGTASSFPLSGGTAITAS